MNPCEYSQELKSDPVGLECGSKGGRCNYHTVGENLAYEHLVPEGICPEAYHNLYYSSLGPLFGSRLPENQTRIKCPGGENYVVYEASFEKLNLRFRLLNIVKRVLYRFIAGQIYKGRLAWTVREVKGTCPLNQNVGDRFFMNPGNFQLTQSIILPMGEPTGLCPAAFDNIFPYLYSYKKEGGFPFRGKSQQILCPDHLTNVTFDIRRNDP